MIRALDVLREKFPRLVAALPAILPPPAAMAFGIAEITEDEAAAMRGKFALVPDDRIERLTDLAIDLVQRLAAAFESVLDKVTSADLAAILPLLPGVATLVKPERIAALPAETISKLAAQQAKKTVH